MSSIYRASTIAKLIAEGRDGAPAIGAPERIALTHQGLRELARRTISDLNRMGIGRNDRVAIVLPNGPEMATAFIAIACGATTAPLNPAYRTEEFDFYLSDLNAKALVVQEGLDGPARAVAAARNIPLLLLRPGTVAGDFSLHGADGAAPATRGGFAEEGDVALVLHTSGTTSRPKPDAGADAARRLPQHHAAVSYSRPDRRHLVEHCGGRLRSLHPRIQCAQILRLV
jgi:acyl-coenzyme A synthetase/AMP-(fatty) acid ligase